MAVMLISFTSFGRFWNQRHPIGASGMGNLAVILENWRLGCVPKDSQSCKNDVLVTFLWAMMESDQSAANVNSTNLDAQGHANCKWRAGVQTSTNRTRH